MSSELLSITTGNEDALLEQSAASRFALEDGAFLDWCKDVRLDYNTLNTHESPLPGTLQNLIGGVRVVPSWMVHTDAHQYQHAKRRFSTFIDTLAADIVSEEFQLCSNDESLSNDISAAIVPIFTVVQQNILAQSWKVKAIEAETRTAIDGLNNHVWNIESSDCFQHRMERRMKLPGTSNENAPIRVTPDSCAFIRAETSAVQGKAARGSCSSIAHPSHEAYYLFPHWINEYKQHDGQKRMSINQVILGLVSGLYQRRSLGFPHHFIFAMAHHGSTKLLMVLYRMREFDTSLPASALQLYLLMKKTCGLAKEYQTAILDATYGPISRTKGMLPGPHVQWPSKEDKKSDGGSSKPNSPKRARLGEPSKDDLGPQTDCQDQSPNDSPMVETPTELYEKRLQGLLVGRGHSLRSGFSQRVEELSSDEKVKKYLSTSVNVIYDPMPDSSAS
ncbi:hypothetical protein CTheo_8875 [Ceratobasidium theobromae]|uniref:Uncharacterized protein n=1 Tax=Ceratobasidium theobromae TaxID=1582974 RepID=A0A5N5Q7H7_9AGAM|nr:hypothetical protein CTheo_8875 [Ceratobasidium theobromae]